MGLIPNNLSVLGRATAVVVANEMLTGTIGLLRITSTLINRKENSNHTNASVASLVGHQDSGDDSDMSSTFNTTALIVGLVIYSAILLFDFLLYFGLRNGRKFLLNVWYHFNLFVITISVMTMLVQAWTLSNTAKWPSSQLVISIFEAWIVSEYLRELNGGATSAGMVYREAVQP